MSKVKSQYIKAIPDSAGAYALLKPITDAAQAGDLKPWSPAITEILASYGISVERLKDVKVQVNLSFPTSTKNPAMTIGYRYAKSDGSFAEDLFLFEEGVGLTCYYRGAQEEALPEYGESHHAKIVLTELLPDLQRDIANIKQQIGNLTAASVEQITDEQFAQRMKQISDDYARHTKNVTSMYGPSAGQQYSRKAQPEFTKMRMELQAKKRLSDQFYKTEKG